MESTIQTVVTGVQPREVTRKRDNARFTIYDVFLQNGGKVATSRKEIAMEAMNLIGQPAQVTVRSEQNGQFQNNYLQAVVPMMAQPATPPPYIQQAQQAQQQAQSTGNGSTTFTTQAQGNTYSPDLKDLLIWRQTATKVAAHMSKTPDEFWSNVEELISFYKTGQRPTVAKAQDQQIFTEQVAEKAAAMPDFYSGPQDDIPF